MKSFFARLTIEQVTSISGARSIGHSHRAGCPCCTQRFNGNTGITGNLKGINNKVPH